VQFNRTSGKGLPMFMFSKRETAPQSPLFDSFASAETTPIEQEEGSAQREMVLGAFQDLIRNTGMPSQMLDCSVHSSMAKDGQIQMHVHLTVKKWSEHLLRHSFAFEKALVQRLDRDEPQVDHSQYEWLWKFDPACGCPCPDLPSDGGWTQKSLFKPNAHTEMPLSAKDVARAHVAAAQAIHSHDFDMRGVYANLKQEDFDPR
jgi:hypothetical protein